MKLKIMTYNICSGHHFEGDQTNHPYEYDLSKCIAEINKVSPVICGLNEVDNYSARTNQDYQTELISKATGMTGFFGKAISFPNQPGSGYGNAVLSRYPILESEVVPIPDAEIHDENTSYETRSITRVKLDVEGTPVTVLQTHFGLAIAEQQNAQQTILKLLDAITGPVILMGDFNIRPDNFLLNPIRERLIDTALLRTEYFKTFPSYECNYPDCKIDYVFVSKHFKPLNLEIVQTKASDHMPYVVELEME